MGVSLGFAVCGGVVFSLPLEEPFERVLDVMIDFKTDVDDLFRLWPCCGLPAAGPGRSMVSNI